MICLYIVKHY